VDDLARLVLLVVFAVFFLQLLRGTTRSWLRAKFLGRA
jgi:hypothetical protein